jgi:ATP-binding cassette subfamily B protein
VRAVRVRLRLFQAGAQILPVADEAEGQLSAVLQENLTGVRVVRAFGRAQLEDEIFGASTRIILPYNA